MCEQTIKKYRQVNRCILFFISMAIGATAGYYGLGLSLLLYSLFKLQPRRVSIQNGRIYKEEKDETLQKLTKMIEGAIIGFITGFVLIPLIMAIVIKLIDGRLQINKNALYMKQLKIPYVPLLPFIIIGIMLGKMVIFLDITLLKVILILFTYFAIFLIYSQKIHEQKKNIINDFRGSQIIKNQDHKLFQIIENIIIGYYLCAYSCLDYLNIWVCLAYVGWVLISDKVNSQFCIDQIFQCLTCPILSVNMENPYAVKQCGHTFQKQNLVQALRLRISCPLCNVRSAPQNIIPNLKVKQINEYLKNQRKGEDQS